MPTRVQIHPTTKIAAIAVVCAIAVVVSILGVKRLIHSDAPHAGVASQQGFVSGSSTSAPLLLPIIELTIADASLEKNWSSALAQVLGGRTEVSIEGGRVDVLTEHYAIEVDRLEKWHEAIGQASHYALKTKKTPVAALIIPSDSWPLAPSAVAKLRLVEETCLGKGIRLVLLRRIGA
jgi:hypothetical protein